MSEQKQSLTRRGFLNKAGAAGLGVAGLSLLGGKADAAHSSRLNDNLIEAATIAEALATTMYYNIIAGPIFTSDLSTNAADQAYLVAGLEQEADHYALLRTSGGPDLTGFQFYFPTGMFTNSQTTVNTLVTLEDAFISAYAIAVRDFNASSLRVLASRFLGIESEHRVLARVIANDLNLSNVTGLGGSEGVTPLMFAANNLAYERVFFSQLSQVVAALGPFLKSGATGFSTTPYTLPAVQINSDGSGTVAMPSGTTKVMLANNTPTP